MKEYQKIIKESKNQIMKNIQKKLKARTPQSCYIFLCSFGFIFVFDRDAALVKKLESLKVCSFL